MIGNMSSVRRFLLALLLGMALVKVLEILTGYTSALPMPWLREFGKHTATLILLLFCLCIILAPAYLMGRILFHYLGRALWVAVVVSLPWILVQLYDCYMVVRDLWSSPSELHATLLSWTFLPSVAIGVLAVPLGLWLAGGSQRRMHRANQ